MVFPPAEQDWAGLTPRAHEVLLTMHPRQQSYLPVLPIMAGPTRAEIRYALSYGPLQLAKFNTRPPCFRSNKNPSGCPREMLGFVCD